MNTRRLWGTIMLMSIMSGTIPAFSKIALESMSPGTLTLVRYTFTALLIVFSTIFLRQTVSWKAIRGAMPVSILAAGNAITFAIGIQYVSAASAQMLYTVVPMLVAVFSSLILRERISGTKYIGIIVGGLGMLLLVFGSVISRSQEVEFTLQGTGIMLFGCVIFALYTVLSKPLQDKMSPAEVLLSTATDDHSYSGSVCTHYRSSCICSRNNSLLVVWRSSCSSYWYSWFLLALSISYSEK